MNPQSQFLRIIAFIILIVSATPLSAQGPLTVAALLASLKGLEHVANSSIEKADNALSKQQRELYANAVNYAAFIRGILGDALNDVDRKLAKHELAIFNEVNTLVTRLEDVSRSTTDKLEEISVAFENTVTKVPGGKNYPTPSFIKIPLLNTMQTRSFVIDIRGVNLGHAKNYIVFAGKKIPVTSVESDKKISFKVSLGSNDVLDHTKFNTFDLFLHKRKFFGGDKQWRYSPRFVVVPQQIATVKTYYRVPQQDFQQSIGQSGIVHATSGSGKTKDVERQFNVVNPASEGWKIDRNSITVRKTRGGGDKHGVGGPYGITEISFVAKAFAKKGHATATTTWNEFRVAPPTDAVQMTEVGIGFDEQKVIDLPKDASLFKTEVAYYDGTKFTSSAARFHRNLVGFEFKQLQRVFEVKFEP